MILIGGAKWELKKVEGGVNISNSASGRRIFARKTDGKGGQHGFGIIKQWEGAKDQVWEVVHLHAKATEAPEEGEGEISWDEIAEKARAAGVSMKEAALEMGVAAKEQIEAIPWEDIQAKAKEMGVSMKEAAKSIPWEEMTKKARTRFPGMRLQRKPWPQRIFPGMRLPSRPKSTVSP